MIPGLFEFFQEFLAFLFLHALSLDQEIRWEVHVLHGIFHLFHILVGREEYHVVAALREDHLPDILRHLPVFALAAPGVAAADVRRNHEKTFFFLEGRVRIDRVVVLVSGEQCLVIPDRQHGCRKQDRAVSLGHAEGEVRRRVHAEEPYFKGSDSHVLRVDPVMVIQKLVHV